MDHLELETKLQVPMDYQTTKSFAINPGFSINSKHILNTVIATNKLLTELPISLYNIIDYKTTSTLIGRFFCDTLATQVEGALVNPIEKGHPDLIPKEGENASESQLRNYPTGLEVKCTIGNIRTGANLRAGNKRIDSLTGITWQAHHQEVTELLGLIWDFANKTNSQAFLYPAITGAFFSDKLDKADWGVISGTTGRNTKVCGMKSSGRKKMIDGLILVYKEYLNKYIKLLGGES